MFQNPLRLLRPVVLGLLILVCAVPPHAQSASTGMEVYRLGPNDVIRIQVLGEDDLTTEGKVGGDGKITFPLLGVLDIQGRTVQQLREELTARLADGYLKQPKVSVSIVRFRNVYISGEVKTPGGYPYEEGLTVRKAISLAGGLTERAEKRGIKVTRATEGHVDTVSVDLSALVFPDDAIVVAPAEKFYVTGEVMHPGGYVYEEGTTVQKAISMAGGFTEKAEQSMIKVARMSDAGIENIAATMETMLAADDMVVIDSQHHKFYVTGEVKNPGGYPFKEGLNVQKAIALAGGPTEKADRGHVQVIRRTNGREDILEATSTTVLSADDTVLVAEGQRFYVTGEVRTPGRYLFDPGTTVQRAVTLAGGFTEKADRAEMTIVRVHGEKLTTIIAAPDVAILPEDMVVVRQYRKIYINGEVKKPGDYPYEKGLTIHKAITMAGGFTDKAAERRTKILRVVNGVEQSIRVKLEELVLPEDIIVVPQSFF